MVSSKLVYPSEQKLGAITLVLGLLAWLVLIVGTFGVALVMLLLGFIAYLFVQSALIAHIKGHGVELTAEQFPDLHGQFLACCERLDMHPPSAYVLHGGGMLNAFATQFLGHRYVVLLAGVVEAMEKHPDGVRFYVGHELGHLRMNHLRGLLFRMPVLWLPLIGAAYARARESTCDLHGLACSSSPENAARALGALSAGAQRWQTLNVEALVAQTAHTKGFWMSLHELCAGYPWLTKRVARVMGQAVPSRNPLAYVLAIFIPYAGPLGAGFGLLMLVYMIGVLAAIAVPQYKHYQTKAKLLGAKVASQPVRDGLAEAYGRNGEVPESLEAAGLPTTGPDGASYEMDSDSMVLTVTLPEGTLVFTPNRDEANNVRWNCVGRLPLTQPELPKDCNVESLALGS